MTISTLPPGHNLSLSSMRHEARFQIEANTDDLALVSGLRILRRWIGMIAVLVTLFTAASLTMIWDLKPIYRAESRLIIHKPLATTLSTEETSRNEPLDLRSETERLLSRSVAERVIRDLKLDQLPEFNPALREVSLFDEVRAMLRALIDRTKQPGPERSMMEPIIPEYHKALRVWRDGLGDVIQIGFDATDPELAAAVPNRLISVYLKERNESIRRRLDAAEEWIRQRIEEQQGRASSALVAADTYREAMSTVLGEDAPSEQLKSLAELNERLGNVTRNREEMASSITTLETADDASLALHNISIPENIGTMVQDLRTQQRDLDRLLETYDNKAQSVIDLRAAIARSGIDLKSAIDRYIETMRTKLTALDQEYAGIRSELTAADEKRSRSVLAHAELARLERIVDREQTALDKLEEQRRDLAGQAMLPGTEVEVLSPASVPIGPQGRGRLFYLIAAIIVSVSIAITIAVLVEVLDRKVRSFDQLAGIGRATSAGLIPRLRRKSWRNPFRSSGKVSNEAFDDAIRGIVMSLKKSNGGELPASIVVTSMRKGEGKSFVARALAIELASNAHPVLYVDGDLRGGNPNSFFRSEPKPGLNEFLSGRAETHDIVQHHRLHGGLDFIPAGRPDRDRRRQSEGLTEILEMARARGQIVIFDTAPISCSKETMHFAALADRTLVVVEWAKTSRHAVETGLRHLRVLRNAEILVTVNRVHLRRHALYNFTDSEILSASTA